MSLAEAYHRIQSSPEEMIARIADIAHKQDGSVEYRPDFMTENFAHGVVEALGARGVIAVVTPSYRKGIHSEAGSTYAVTIIEDVPDNVIHFPAT